MNDLKQQAKRELVCRELEKRYKHLQDDFPEFCKFFYKRERGHEFLWNWHHQMMVDKFMEMWNDDNKDLLIINIPPGHTKTLLISQLLPVWLLARKSDTRIISTGYSSSLTQTFSAEARDYYDSESFKLVFPRAANVDPNQKARDNWRLEDAEGRYYAAGAGGSITGHRAHLFIIDDPINPNDIEMSGLKLERINTWFSNVARSRLFPNGKFVIVMQRLHDNDLCGYLQREFKKNFDSGRWNVLSLQGIAEASDNHRLQGEALFPQMYPIEKLNDIKEAMINQRGANFFSAQYQQNPVDVERAEFKREWFRYYREPDLHGRELKTFIAVDPAISQRQTADYTAIAAVSKDIEGRFYIRTIKYGKLTPDEMMDEVFSLQSAFKCPVIIETVNFQKVLAENIKKHMAVKQQFFTLHEISTRGEKEARIRSTLQPLYSNFKIFHREEDKHGELEEELVRFPRGMHDDLVDALETAISQFSLAPVVKQSIQTKSIKRHINNVRAKRMDMGL